MKILKNVSALAENATSRLNGAMAPISMVMKGSHLLGTWYGINPTMSQLIDGLDVAQSYIGTDSTIVYDKIENMIFMGGDDLVTALSFDEDAGGNTIEYTGTMLIFCDTVQVRQHSYFTLNVFNKPYLFKVNSFSQNTALQNPCYSIEFELAHTEQSKIDQIERQVKREYIMAVAKIGPDDSLVVEKSVFYDRRTMSFDYIELIETYHSLFFDKNTSCFVLKTVQDEGVKVNYIDQVLMTMMYQENIGVFDPIIVYAENNYDGRFKKVFIDEPKYVSDKAYDRSILMGILTKKFKMSNLPYPMLHIYNSQMTRHYRDTLKLIGEYTDKPLHEEYLVVFTEELVDKIKTGVIYGELDETKNKSMKNLIIDYVAGRELDFAQLEIEAVDSLENYYLIPLVAAIYQKHILAAK